MEISKNHVDTPLYKNTFEKRVLFFLVSVGVITLTYGFLYLIDFLPEKPGDDPLPAQTGENEVRETEEGTLQVIEAENEDETASRDPNPITIIFDTLDRRVNVLNPSSTSIAALDNALLSGVVRHPDSADFQNEGTIFLFGHSSYLPKVINKNFQAFNGIQNLKWGDTVRLQSRDREYVYRVDRVYQAKASDAEVVIERGKAKLTLATCNSFGSKDDRYIVEASLIDSYTI